MPSITNMPSSSNRNPAKLYPTLPTQADRVALHNTVSALPRHIIKSILEGAATKSPLLVKIIQEVADAVKESQPASEEPLKTVQGSKLGSWSGEAAAGPSNISTLPRFIIESILEGAATVSPTLLKIIQRATRSQPAHEQTPGIVQGDELTSSPGEAATSTSKISVNPLKRKFGDEDGNGNGHKVDEDGKSKDEEKDYASSPAFTIRVAWMNKFDSARQQAHILINGTKSLPNSDRGLVRIIVEVFGCTKNIINRVIDETGVWGCGIHELKRTAASVLMEIMDSICTSHPDTKVVGLQKGQVPIMLMVATKKVLQKMGKRERELLEEYCELKDWQKLVEQLLDSGEEQWAPGFQLEVAELMEELLYLV